MITPLIAGTARPASPDIAARVAERIGCREAVVRAVMDVESCGSGFDDAGRLIIRPEKHKLWAWLKRHGGHGDAVKGRALGLATVKPYAWRRPYRAGASSGGDERWQWMRRTAEQFGPEAACWATSAGTVQIMGFNARSCGYDSAVAMFQAFADSEDAQLMALAERVVRSDMADAFVREDVHAIARWWNGAGYMKGGYHIKLADAIARHGGLALVRSDHARDMTGYGAGGARVRDLQDRLIALGYPLAADGDFGPETRAAVRAFQEDRGITVDGLVGPETERALAEAPPKEPRDVGTATVLARDPEAQAAASVVAVGTMTGGSALATTMLEGAWSKVAAITFPQFVGLLASAAVIYGLYALWKRRRALRHRLAALPSWWGA